MKQDNRGYIVRYEMGLKGIYRISSCSGDLFYQLVNTEEWRKLYFNSLFPKFVIERSVYLFSNSPIGIGRSMFVIFITQYSFISGFRTGNGETASRCCVAHPENDHAYQGSTNHG